MRWTFLYLLSTLILCKCEQCSLLSIRVILHQTGEGIRAGKDCEIVPSYLNICSVCWLKGRLVFVTYLFYIQCPSKFSYRVVLKFAYLFAFTLGLCVLSPKFLPRKGGRVVVRMAANDKLTKRVWLLVVSFGKRQCFGGELS